MSNPNDSDAPDATTSGYTGLDSNPAQPKQVNQSPESAHAPQSSTGKDSSLLSKRRFLGYLGVGAAALAAAGYGAKLFGLGPFAQKIKLADKSQMARVSVDLIDTTSTRILDNRTKPGTPMSYRASSTLGDTVSLLGFGTMRYPIKDSGKNPDKAIDEPLALELVKRAYANGINYFDTAWFYHNGTSEAFTGKALSPFKRDTYYLATKMPTPLLPTLEQAIDIFEQQLTNCRTDYFDYYLLHNLQTIGAFREVYETNGVLDYLLKQKKLGRIRHLGWSFHGDHSLFDYLMDYPIPFDFAQIQLNYHDWLSGSKGGQWISAASSISAREMYQRLSEKKLPVVIMEPLLGGALAQLNEAGNSILRSKEPQASVASWAFRFCGSLPNVLTVLSGMTYMEHLDENLKTFSPLKPLNASELSCLGQALHAYKNDSRIGCTGCNYCMPCPFGVDIPGVFAHYNKCVQESRLPTDKMDRNYALARRAYLVGYDREIPPLAQADHCIGCGRCEKHCPQNLPIIQQMNEIATLSDKLKRNL